MFNNEKANDVGDGDANDNEMDYWCQACQTDIKNDTQTYNEIDP